MSKRYELIDTPKLYVTWTSPSEWSRYRSREFWFAGFMRARPSIPYTYVRFLGLEIAVSR